MDVANFALYKVHFKFDYFFNDFIFQKFSWTKFFYMIKKINFLIDQPKYHKIKKYFSFNSSFTILDVGGGSGNSLLDFKKYFPNCRYSCIDLFENHVYTKKNGSKFENYWQINLADSDLSLIPNNYFDIIVCTHVIEHLFEGDKLLEEMFKKIKLGGYIYLEYPAERSLFLPSMTGTLNFFDDDTHVRIYKLHELLNICLKNKMLPVNYGTRRNYWRLPFVPFLILIRLLRGSLNNKLAYQFWDIFGFAEYIYAQKKIENVKLSPYSFT